LSERGETVGGWTPREFPYAREGPAPEASWIIATGFSHGNSTMACGRGFARAPRATSSCMKGSSPAASRPTPKLDQLDEAPGTDGRKSRLGCQCVPDGNARPRLSRSPSGNKNFAKGRRSTRSRPCGPRRNECRPHLTWDEAGRDRASSLADKFPGYRSAVGAASPTCTNG